MKESRIKKHGNKGMTLVELIIVVAILAVLAATIALSVIHYIEKSRQAKDLYHASIIKDAMNVYTFPSNMPGEHVDYYDPDTHVLLESYNRAWIYVDHEEIRCSNPSCALAMISAGLINVSPEFEEALKECEEKPRLQWYRPTGPDGDYYRREGDEYVFMNDLHCYATRDWNTYQLDIYLDDEGNFHRGASASNLNRRGDPEGQSKDEETSRYFANALGFHDAKITPIGNQYTGGH